jgi:hypothetical protein
LNPQITRVTWMAKTKATKPLLTVNGTQIAWDSDEPPWVKTEQETITFPATFALTASAADLEALWLVITYTVGTTAS